ncbi:MAG: type IX secretion system protein PorQ, partial [Bacteroidales bacterium]|nr:type IX secretion system protein PorQ [Bacteroidales bacterium]
MTRRILSIVSALLLPLGTLAQEVGGYGFLDIPVSARLSAMGGSVISISESESSLTQHNPSLLGSDMHRQVSLSYLNWLSDIHLANVSYTHRFLSEGAWQAGVRYVSYGEFEGYDEWGVSTGSFSAHDVAFTLSVGHPLTEHWRIGGSVRAIGSKYESESAFALGVDAGLNFYNNETGRSWSLSVTNLGGQLKSLGERHIHMPTRLLVGYTKELEHLPFALTLTGLDLLNWDHTNLLDH